MTHDCRLISIRGCVAVAVLTEGDGPLLFGLAPSDLTLAEIEAYLENAGPLTPSDITSREVASRGKYIRILGIAQSSQHPAIYLDDKSLSGLKISEDAGGYTFFVYNVGAALTTGASLQVATQIFIDWLP